LACIFSQTRGTPRKYVGRVSMRASGIFSRLSANVIA